MQVLSDPAERVGHEHSARVDATPAGLPVPLRPEQIASHYDLTMSHPDVRSPQFAAFDRWLAQAAAEYGLSCALIHDGTVAEFLRRLGDGQLTIGYHLDYFALWHRPQDLYARLAQTVEDAGGQSVNRTARASVFTDKAVAVTELLGRGLGVPATKVLRQWTPACRLTPGEREAFAIGLPGHCVYVKPANGFGGEGVVRVEATDEAVNVAVVALRGQEPDETVLIQRAICPQLLTCEDGVARPAYWRILYQMGDILPFWWQRGGSSPSYRALSRAELQRHRLEGVLAYVRALADLTGLAWFSTELCLGDGAETSCFTVTGPDGRERPVLAIDPVNDQCDVDVQSRWPGAPPDDVVRRIAVRFAERAWQIRQRAVRPGADVSYRVAA